MKKTLFLAAIILTTKFTNAQNPDSIRKSIDLTEIEITDTRSSIGRMPDIKETTIYSGKKSEVVYLSKLDADLSVNNTRQIFGKIPGVTIWENDGSGIQVGVATRGLSPNRSWEFNVRQNGYDICAEVFGYPEAYFSPPMEAVEKIEVVRGAASLAYGPQFGGLLNYVIKKGSKEKDVSFETQQTVGSYGLFNSYNAIGGTYRKLNYYAYFHHRNADGWRENSMYDINTGYISLNYLVTTKLNVGVQYTGMSYKSQQPGGLTDSLFSIDPRQSLRERNWFNAPWNVIAFNSEYEFSSNTRVSLKYFSTISDRNSVGFTSAITTYDTINTTISSYNHRQVDRDAYKNHGAELRLLTSYNLFRGKHSLSTGVRVYNGNTHRRQLGIGTSGNDFDLTITNNSNGKEFGRDLEFITQNYAFYAENIFNVTSRLSITPGIRYEIISSSREGYINTNLTGAVNYEESNRKMFLYGIGTQYKVTSESNVYGNFSSAYRPVTYSEITPSSTTEVIDTDLKDASGYNIDAGYRGRLEKYLNFDLGVFYLYYNDRIGTITQNNAPFRTNIGASVSKGVEALIEINTFSLLVPKSHIGELTLYTSYAYINAEYTKWNNETIAHDPSRSIKGKRVENSPEVIARYGLTYSLNNFSATFQLNNISDVFTDAANTEKPNAAGTIGKIPGYQVMDATISYSLGNNYNIKFGVNNLGDEKYATRRAGGYPGPALMPANGRTFFLSVGFKL